MSPLTGELSDTDMEHEEEEDDDVFGEDMEAIRRACMLTSTSPNDGGDDCRQLSGTDKEEEDDEDDDGSDGEMEAIRRACMLTGTNPDDLLNNSKNKNSNDGGENRRPSFNSESDSDDADLGLLRQIKSRYLNLSNTYECDALSLKPLSSLPPDVSDEEEDDYQTLLHVQKRFASYQNDTLSESQSGSLGPTTCSGFPKAAQVFMEAIKKNRSSQKFIRNKLIQIEAKIEENKKLKERVKILKDFQVSCKKRTGEALSQKKDPRVQLILFKKLPPRATSKDSKGHDKRVSAMYYGPAENSHVSNYRMALTEFQHSLDRKKWSKAEKKSLENGIRQQFQEMVLQSSVEDSSCSERPYGDSYHIDDILASIKDLEITAENLREFLPKVNWEKLASMYLVGRTGGECEARWLNWEDPLINHKSWTAEEEANLQCLVLENGVNNWFDIAVSLGTNRTPFQCLAHYQRTLNPSILEREWTKDEDARLRSAVETFGEGDWQSIASVVRRRTGTQCSNRWKKSLHPTRKREGRWTPEEDKRLKVAQMLFGPKNWNKTAEFVPGRTQAQCRDRYVNCLEPSLKWGEWTEEEDSRLVAAYKEHGPSWSKVAACVTRRTDNMCWRRWKTLFPEDASSLKEEKRIKKAALPCNFVDRESERPALGPNDFLPPIVSSTKALTYPKKQNGKLRKALNKIRTRRHSKNSESCSKIPGIDSSDASNKKKKDRRQQQKRQKGIELTEESHVAGTSDGDDTTLACFLRNKSNKRKLAEDCPANGIQNRSELHPEVDQLHDENPILLCQQDDIICERLPPCSPQSSHLNDNPTTMASDNEHGGLNFVRGRAVFFQEPVGKVVGDGPRSDHDTDDIVLTSGGKKKLKKRHPQTPKSGPQVCPPSSVMMGSKSLPKRVDQPDDQNQTAFVAISNEPGALDQSKPQVVGACEPVREIVNSCAEGGHESGDMTLSCFLRNKSKSRRQSRRGDIHRPG